MTWQQWVALLITAGVFTTVASLVKDAIGWATGRNQSRVKTAEHALDAMAKAGAWADAYYAFKDWCQRKHGFEPDYPRPPTKGPKDD